MPVRLRDSDRRAGARGDRRISSSYGPNLRVLAVYLLAFQHIPVERAAILVRDVTGAEVSTGWVASLLPEAADLVEDSLHLIRALLVLGHVLHADETTTCIGAPRRCLYVACTDCLTLLHRAPRSRPGPTWAGSCRTTKASWSTTRCRCMPDTPAAPTNRAAPI